MNKLTSDPIAAATARVKREFDKWLEVTGIFENDSGYYAEVTSFFDDLARYIRDGTKLPDLPAGDGESVEGWLTQSAFEKFKSGRDPLIVWKWNDSGSPVRVSVTILPAPTGTEPEQR